MGWQEVAKPEPLPEQQPGGAVGDAPAVGHQTIMNTIDVAIVEDNAGLRGSLELLLAESPGYRCVGAYENAGSALRELPERKPMVVLMDINLPDISGIECTRRLKELLPGVQVIIVTVYGDHDSIFKALRAGASGYLLKRSHPDVILQAISEVRQGGAPMTSEIARKVVEVFQSGGGEERGEALSRREEEVLELLAQGMTDKEIAGKLHVSVPTVRFHLGHIYEKLHVRSRTSAVLKFHAGREPVANA